MCVCVYRSGKVQSQNGALQPCSLLLTTYSLLLTLYYQGRYKVRTALGDLALYY